MSSKLPFDPKNHEPFGDIFKQMNQFLHENRPIRGILQSIDDFFQAPFPQFTFAVEVTETERDHIILAELAGVNKEQIQIDVLGNALTISVLNNEELSETDETRQRYQKRQSMSRTSRTLSLPFPINEKAVKASYKNGLLEITIPKNKGKKIIIDHEE
ncbi:Hsp20/alpha crystallin family protein [Bacillus sp. DNRA2]|uniref:Hsp20/alpha crystallin family protein n=1 Tax=Bacillus sp. DNRA2 TaxID=2723053 RepID=UPI00145F0EFA|nr:Hsp20/alpha crystallin family protein [Bacillus sp. DNRA2]NMD70359.1 Hsp20/alpha crystallin family protein [Bacillus sp. DNRA2]